MEQKDDKWDEAMRQPQNLVTLEKDDEMDISSDESSMTLASESDHSMYITDEEEITEESITLSDSELEEEPEVKKRKREDSPKPNKLDTFCIYKIYPKQDCKALYIGSTTNFTRRVYQHKKNSKNTRKKEFLYKYIRAMGGFDNFVIEKVMDYPCETRQEGIKKEKELIESLNANLNSIMLPKKVA